MDTEYNFFYLKDNNRLNTSYYTMILNLLNVFKSILLQPTKTFTFATNKKTCPSCSTDQHKRLSITSTKNNIINTQNTAID